jgi:hypothetical protein
MWTASAGSENDMNDRLMNVMYRLEASRPGAELALAIALLRAWIASDSETEMPHSREWLKTICPICLDMIEATKIVSDTERQCIQ